MSGSKTRRLALKKADKYFSQYVRLSASDLNGICRCITCGKVTTWKNLHCGHFQSRRYIATRFDERNVAPQCVSCNTFHGGMQYEFGKKVDAVYGSGTAEKLQQMTLDKQKVGKVELEEIAEKYRVLAKLEAQKRGVDI